MLDDDLTRRFAVERRVPENGSWLVLSSHDHALTAFKAVVKHCGDSVEEFEYRVFDQQDRKVVV